MIRCSDAVRQLWQYLEGELPAQDRAKVDEHLAACLRCCGEAEFADELRRFLGSHGEDDAIPDAVRQRLLATLESLPESP
jgi:mycothiol system anti-sigma-R factor